MVVGKISIATDRIRVFSVIMFPSCLRSLGLQEKRTVNICDMSHQSWVSLGGAAVRTEHDENSCNMIQFLLL